MFIVGYNLLYPDFGCNRHRKMIKLANTIAWNLIILPIFGLLCYCQEVNPEPSNSNIPVDQQVLADGFDIPRAIEVISEEEFLFTERMGALYHYRMGEVNKVDGLPESRTYRVDREYGGMMDISLHPKYELNQMMYLAFVDQSLA